MGIRWVSRDELLEIVLEYIVPTHVILDVGAGIRPQTLFVPTVHLIIEPFTPYIERIKNSQNEIPRKIFLNGTWDKIMPFLPDKSIDTVFALDVIEHLEKEDGVKFLREAERVAKTQVVIFTPLGLYPQSYEAGDETDRWGMSGGYWQSHRSGWMPEDFEQDWDFLICKDFHEIDQHGEKLVEPFGAFWAIKTWSKKSAPFDERYVAKELPVKVIWEYFMRRAVAEGKRRISKLIKT